MKFNNSLLQEGSAMKFVSSCRTNKEPFHIVSKQFLPVSSRDLEESSFGFFIGKKVGQKLMKYVSSMEETWLFWTTKSWVNLDWNCPEGVSGLAPVILMGKAIGFGSMGKIWHTQIGRKDDLMKGKKPIAWRLVFVDGLTDVVTKLSPFSASSGKFAMSGSDYDQLVKSAFCSISFGSFPLTIHVWITTTYTTCT